MSMNNLRDGMDIALEVPGAEKRMGIYISYTGIDTLHRVKILAKQTSKGVKLEKEPYFYLGHDRDLRSI